MDIDHPPDKTNGRPGTETPSSVQADSEVAPAGADVKTGEGKEAKKHEKTEPDEAKSLKAKLKKKDHEAKALKKELDELKDRYLRAVAEMDNQRKRLEREKSDYLQFALSDLIRELLQVLDNFERALKSRDQADGKAFEEGVARIYKQFQDELRKRGVTPIETGGGAFDPEVHQAVMTEESAEAAEPHIGEELQKGYLLHGRLLRPALVKVIIPKKG